MPETQKKDYIAGFTVDDISEDFYALYLTSKKYKRDTSIQLKVNAQSGNWITGQVDYQTGDMDITSNHKYPEEARMIAHFKEGIALFLERINGSADLLELQNQKHSPQHPRVASLATQFTSSTQRNAE